MGYNFRDYKPNQLLLLPPNLDAWLSQAHLARFISDVVDALDLKPFLRRFRDNGQGGAAFHPAMMLKVVLYAYYGGVPSSRKIAQAVIDDVAFRWLAANNRPDFRIIATFRRKHLENIKSLFLQVLLMCKQAGMVRVGVVALDGTKVSAAPLWTATVPRRSSPKSRILKTRKRFIQGYNAQAVVSEDQIVVACDVVQECNDVGQLVPMVEAAEVNLYEIGEEPGKVLADVGTVARTTWIHGLSGGARSVHRREEGPQTAR